MEATASGQKSVVIISVYKLHAKEQKGFYEHNTISF